ncbi:MULTISPECIES: hypothetical protein [Geobacillus]|uniref:hypothetical protein n=1 Tax=Geobacillus sp. T6 TaxID=1659191 RepID=UPI001F529A8D|nr:MULTISPECIES: hypothetical protein [Geobacillus]
MEQNIQKDQADDITGLGLALRIDPNQPLNQLGEAKILEDGVYDSQIGTFINHPNSNVHDGKTPLRSLCFKVLSDNPPDFGREGAKCEFIHPFFQEGLFFRCPPHFSPFSPSHFPRFIRYKS